MESYTCGFCGLEFEEDKLKKGLNTFVCKDCVDTLNEEEAFNNFKSNNEVVALKPHLIKRELDKYVIGQEIAKKKIAVEVCNHYKRINFKTKSVELPKSNILLLGPTGSGKTYILEVLSKVLDVPLVIGDATGLTESGYIGKDVDSLLFQLIEKADGDISKAEKGIIYIDEIDKIASAKEDSGKKGVGDEGVQASLLKIIEGMDYIFDKTGETINTRNILFVCGGAFEGLTDIIEDRVTKKSKIGFNVNSSIKKYKEDEKSKLLHEVTTDDLAEFGLIKEFIGRLHLVATLDELTIQDLRQILTKPKNALIKQYQALLKLDGVKLKFEKDALDYISVQAKNKGTGARGLKSVMSDKLNELLFNIPLQKEKEDINEYTVTKEYLSS